MMNYECWMCGKKKRDEIVRVVFERAEPHAKRLICGNCYSRMDSLAVYSIPARKKQQLLNPPEPNREKYPLEDFMAQVAKRLEKGAVEYGAESYLTDNVTRQIKEELEDVAGWASLGWAKLNRVEELWKELRELVGSEEG